MFGEREVVEVEDDFPMIVPLFLSSPHTHVLKQRKLEKQQSNVHVFTRDSKVGEVERGWNASFCSNSIV